MYGIIEYAHYDDYKYALDYLDGRPYKNKNDGQEIQLRFIKGDQLLSVERHVSENTPKDEQKTNYPTPQQQPPLNPQQPPPTYPPQPPQYPNTAYPPPPNQAMPPYYNQPPPNNGPPPNMQPPPYYNQPPPNYGPPPPNYRPPSMQPPP